MYLYKTTIILNIDFYQGLSSSIITQNNIDKSDFENNYKSSCVQISDLNINGTVFNIYKSYTEFKQLIISPILWTDIKYINDGNKYTLLLL